LKEKGDNMKIVRTIVIILGLIPFLFLRAINVEASIVLKVIGVNPSPTHTQKIPMKVYLPKEVKPENIIDKGDLEIGYDDQQGSYYVYGEYELGPGEVLEREVEMEDIWVIPEREILLLKTEIEKIADLLEGTNLEEKMSFLKETMEEKLDRIIESQKIPEANPQRHISNYRENTKLLEEVKKDLVIARTLLTQAKQIPSVKIWKLFIVIVGFLGLLGVIFYFVWQKESKLITRVSSKPPVELAKEFKEEEEEGLQVKDIEKIIKKEE